MFDTRQMEYIITIADEQSLTKAADRLFISQSALSQHIKKLEDSGVPKLFEYRNGKMLPTHAGKIYVNGLRMILEINRQAIEDIREPDGISYPPLRIALLRTVQRPFYTLVLPKFKSLFPRVLLDIKTLSYLNIAGMLNENKLDMAVYGTSDTHLPQNTFLLGHDEYVLIIPSRMHDYDVNKIPLAVAQAASNQYSLQQSAMREWKLDNPIYAYCNDIEGALSLVQNGLCGCIINKSLVNCAANVIISNSLKPYHFKLVAACSSFREPTLPQKQMIEILQETFKDQSI